MKARYSKPCEGNSGKVTCAFCNTFDWFVVVERGGGRCNFYLCMHCGNKVEVPQ